VLTSLITVGAMLQFGQCVPSPRTEDLVRWNLQCWKLPPTAWPAIDSAHDKLIATLRSEIEIGLDESVRRQAEAEREFFGAIAQLRDATVIDGCEADIVVGRAEARLRAVLVARSARTRIPDTAAIFAGCLSLSPEARFEIRRVRRDNVERLQHLVDAPLNQPTTGARPLLDPAERAGLAAVSGLLAVFRGQLSSEELEKATDRLERTALGHASADDVGRTIAVLRNLRSSSPESAANARRIAIQIEAIFREWRQNAALIAMRGGQITMPGEVVTEDQWAAIAKLVPQGQDLVDLCRIGGDASDLSDKLQALVTDEGLELLQREFHLLPAEGGANIAQALVTRKAWERETHDRMGASWPSPSDLALLETLGTTSADKAAAQAAVAAWTTALQGAIATDVEKLQERRWATRESAQDRCAKIEEVSKRTLQAEATLRDVLVPILTSDANRAQFALWRLGRLCGIVRVLSAGESVWNSLPADLNSPMVPELYSAGQNSLPALASCVMEVAADLEGVVLQFERSDRAERQHDMYAKELNRDAMNSQEGTLADRLADAAARTNAMFPSPRVSAYEMWNRWCERRRSALARLGDVVPADTLESIRRGWGERSLREGGQATRVRIEQLVGTISGDEANELIERIQQIADRGLDHAIDAVFDCRFSSDDEGMTNAWRRAKQAVAELREDRDLAIARLNRDLAGRRYQ